MKRFIRSLIYAFRRKFRPNQRAKCPWCGGDILPGDYVTLYSPKDPKNYKIPDGVTVYSRSPLRLVGCQRQCCCSSGADYSGRWTGKEVERFESALEECMRTGKPVIRNF